MSIVSLNKFKNGLDPADFEAIDIVGIKTTVFVELLVELVVEFAGLVEL